MLLVPTKLAERDVEVPLLNEIVGVYRSGSEKEGIVKFIIEFIETLTVPRKVLPSEKQGGLLGIVTVIL
jgi:hypothetical protein